MKRKGIAQPGKHIVVISYDRPPEKFGGRTLDLAYAVVLFKKTPFTQDADQALPDVLQIPSVQAVHPVLCIWARR